VLYFYLKVSKGEIEEGSAAHAGMHAFLAYAGASAMQRNGLIAAAASGGSSLLTNVFGKSTPDETEGEKIHNRNVMETAAAIMGMYFFPSQTSTAVNAVLMNVDNNWLASRQKAQYDKEYEAAVGLKAKLKVAVKWRKLSKSFLIFVLLKKEIK